MSKLSAMLDAERGRLVRTLWKHYKTGKLYTILSLVIMEATQEIAVVYAPLRCSVSFVRVLWEWEEIVLHDGKSVRRFTESKG